MGSGGGASPSSWGGRVGGMWRWAKETMRAEISLELEARDTGGGAAGEFAGLGAGGVGDAGCFPFSMVEGPAEAGGRGKYFSR